MVGVPVIEDVLVDDPFAVSRIDLRAADPSLLAQSDHLGLREAQHVRGIVENQFPSHGATVTSHTTRVAREFPRGTAFWRT